MRIENPQLINKTTLFAFLQEFADNHDLPLPENICIIEIVGKAEIASEK